MKIRKLAVIAAASGALALTVVSAGPASADYAPGPGDAVMVGSDTLQYAGDFVADGDATGVLGFNSSDPQNKLVNFDATADANARLAYGPDGKGSGTCAPGTGTVQGTGNATTSTGNTVCQLNPTIVLRAGLLPSQRPNGSGDGATALANEIAQGVHVIDASRASSSQASVFGASNTHVATVTIGTEKLAMLGSATSHMPAGGLTKAELALLYQATSGSANPFVSAKTTCPTWADISQYRNNANSATGSNGPTAGVSTNQIYPLVPQAGSGTRKYFWQQLGYASDSFGGCTSTVEENDPTAIAGSGHADDAIEPMSGARLNLYRGLDGSGNSTGVHYFQDPSCKYTVGNAAGTCGSTSPAAGSVAHPNALNPAVTFYAASATSDSEFTRVRSLYIYIRKDDISNRTRFEPGIDENLVRTLFADPCAGIDYDGTNLDVVANQTRCATDPTSGGFFGPSGPPVLASSAGYQAISSAGITPGYVYTDHVI